MTCSGVILRWYGSIEDVNARREAVERLRESEETHRLTLERARVVAGQAQLAALAPTAILARGYAIVRNRRTGATVRA